MDPKTKAEAAGLGAKIITFLIYVMPPVIAANITHWAATIVAEKKISRRKRLAMSIGSFGLAAVAHFLCVTLNMTKWEFMIVWATTMSANQILKFFFQEFGDIFKNMIKLQLEQFIKKNEKK